MILITAFEPFGGQSVNASAEVLKRLPETIGGHAVVKDILPVVFGKAAEQALRHPADLIFLLGEAGRRQTVTPELKAKNIRDARIADNEGNQPQREPILPDGADEYHTVIPVEEIVGRMPGDAVSASHDAGTFVCNDTFYLTGMKSKVPVEFIHVPAIPAKADEYAAVVVRFIELAIEQYTIQFSGK